MSATYAFVASRRLGLLTHEELTNLLGWTQDQIDHAVATGRLRRMRRGVYLGEGAVLTRDVVVLAAQLAAGADHVVSHESAAELWGFQLRAPSETIHLLTTSTSRARLAGITTHRTDALPSAQVSMLRRIPVTSPARTLIDTSGAQSPKLLRANVHEAIRSGVMTPAAFLQALDAVPASGRRHRVLAEQVARALGRVRPGESEGEVDVATVLVDEGFPRPAQQIRVRGAGWSYRIDVGYPDLLHGFEYLGERDHLASPIRFHDDQLRTLRLQSLGWTLWPVTKLTPRADIVRAASTIFGR